MILRPKSRDQFYSWYVNSKHDWICLYNFSPITFAQICSLANHSLPNVRDAVKATAEGRGRIYRGIKIKEKPRRYWQRETRRRSRQGEAKESWQGGYYQEKEKRIAKRIGKVILTRQRYEEKKIMRGWRDEDKCINNCNKENQSNQ